MTPAARQFVAPLTFESLSGYPVYEDVFERPNSWEMEHISWARWADAVIVAPGTSCRHQIHDGVQRRAIHPIEFVRVIATARILMPRAMVRLSAGRTEMSDELQALCFLAGANSIFAGEKLLTTGNPAFDRDKAMFARLGLTPRPAHPTI